MINDESMNSFVTNVVNSYIAWDIITYLSMGRDKKNATVEEISDSIGRNRDDILPILQKFAGLGYIRQDEKIGKIFYTISADKEKESKIEDFIKFASTREGRLKIIYTITKLRMEH